MENSMADGPGPGTERSSPSPESSTNTPPYSMKNRHLYRSAVMHLACFLKKKKKISSMYFVSSQVSKKKKNERSLFSL